jgi:hypothetical protein
VKFSREENSNLIKSFILNLVLNLFHGSFQDLTQGQDEMLNQVQHDTLREFLSFEKERKKDLVFAVHTIMD